MSTKRECLQDRVSTPRRAKIRHGKGLQKLEIGSKSDDMFCGRHKRMKPNPLNLPFPRLLNHLARLFHRNIMVCASLLWICVQLEAQDQRVDMVKIRVDPKTVLTRISEDYLGFGYETSAVAQSNFFSAKNVTMAQLYRNLSPHGLIRIGGIISDHSKYVPDGHTGGSHPEGSNHHQSD